MNDRPSVATTEVPYTVRESPRARRVTLRMTVERGLEVVVPRGFDRKQVSALVVGKTAWIRRAEKHMAGERARLAAEPPDSLPDRIELAAVGEVWVVEYRETASRSVTARARVLPTRAGAGDVGDSLGSPAAANGAGAAGETANGVLRVSGAVDDPEACRAALRRWLARTADGRLSALLATVAAEEQLSFFSVSVRGQRTRWGSCSRRGVISLNRHLLFLPSELVRYVLVHELCHTLRSDHSPAFWREVRRREPGVERLRKELRVAGRFVPGWARAPRG